MRPWWHNMVGYRVDIRLFRDSDGDGIGDLDGIRERLGYLHLLGVDNLWLTGVLANPLTGAGGGREVDPVLGDLDAFDKLVTEVHEHGMGVTMDLPAHHTAPHHPGFGDELARALRFWAGRGVDGVRLGITPGMARVADETVGRMVQLLRPVADELGSCSLNATVDRYFRTIPGLDELDVGTDSRFPTIEFDAARIRTTIEDMLADYRATDVHPVWALADWSRPRLAGRFGTGVSGVVRARATALVQLALPGIAGLDTGEELGLSEHNTTERVAGQPTRSPMPWTREGSTFGFSEAANAPPTPEFWGDRTVESQLEDTASTLSLYREAIELRRAHLSNGSDTIEWYGAPAGCLAFRRGRNGLTCALNTSSAPVSLPPGEVLLSSSPLVSGMLPADTAVWLG